MDQGPRGHQGASEVPPPAGRFTHSITHPPACQVQLFPSNLFLCFIIVLLQDYPGPTFLNNHPSSSFTLHLHIRSFKKTFFSDGSSPVCSDGSAPQKPDRPPRGGPCSDGRFFSPPRLSYTLDHAIIVCMNSKATLKSNAALIISKSLHSTPTCGGASPVCPDGSALNTESRRKCTGGRWGLDLSWW